MDKIGLFAVPAIIGCVILYGFIQKTDLFDAFRSGAADGIRSLLSIAPSLIGLVFAVNMLNASGFLEMIAELLSPLCSRIGIAPELIPLGLIRPVSGSGSFAVLSSLLESFGPDSAIGRSAAVMAASSETTFYAVAVYYGAVGIKKTGYTIPCALAADLAVFVLACLLVK